LPGAEALPDAEALPADEALSAAEVLPAEGLARRGSARRTFGVAAGGLVCRSCWAPGAASASAPTIDLMSALLRGDWGLADASERRYRVECSGLVAAYVQWHLEHSIRSLRHVEHA
jgi:DNA repair protein RecO (recombination protein O)